MRSRFSTIAALAAANDSVVSMKALTEHGVDRRRRCDWVRAGWLVELGPRSYSVIGASPTWRRSLVAGLVDLDDHGYIAGRAGCQLHGLDGFDRDHVEFLLHRSHRSFQTTGTTASTRLPIDPADVCMVDGLTTLRPERLILDAPLFGFSKWEIENAIDSAIRTRLVSEQRLRTRVIARHRQGINGGRVLLDALVDTGGESRLERMFLRLCREAGLPRPTPQRTYRDGSRVVARVDFLFPCGLLVEVLGFGTHSSRQHLQRDVQRRTELFLRGETAIEFTYDDLRDRPGWVTSTVMAAHRRFDKAA